jgi:hypothetical protein
VDNVPEPLKGQPIPLLAADDWQMSFGERAALEGILCQLRPRLAVEIGTAAGGSLRRLARHSQLVHSFDLEAPAADIAQAPNVRLHTGDSHSLLPAWLDGLTRPIDFALIDGDHTPLGVHADLAALLDSGRCEQTVILLHDTAQPMTRSGIEGALTGRHGLHIELDFLPGYVFTRGVFAGERWGGLGLVVTGEPGATTQDLYRST